jgi:hypothetical protein
MEDYLEGGQTCIPIAPPGIGLIDVPQFIMGMSHRTNFEIAFQEAAE